MEDNLPKMIREMMTFYVEQKFEKRFDLFLTKDEFEKKMSYKMDCAVFQDFQRQEANSHDLDTKEF
jgi:hypothetical protein